MKMSLPQSSVGSNSLPGIPDKETLLQQTYLEAFHRNYDAVQRWTRWKEDHERVKSTLSSLPDSLSHEVVIPFGSKALMKAKLVHTNEVLTCIGSSWFVKQSAKQGEAMCDRRIKQSEEMLKKLEAERQLLSNRQTLPKLEEAFPSDDTKEIVEEYNEEAEAEWRRQHRVREAEYRRQLAELRKRQVDHPPLKTEEDIFQRLDELELEEELNDELERLHAEYEADYENSDEEEEDDQITDEEDESKLLESDSGTVKEIVSEPETHTIHQSNPNNLKYDEECTDHNPRKSMNCDRRISDGSKSVLGTDSVEKNLSIEPQNLQKGRRISFADEARVSLLSSSVQDGDVPEENIYIRFTHSSVPSSLSPSKGAPIKVANEAPTYLTPADIYDIQKMNCKPKSILKKSSSFSEKGKEKEKANSLPKSASFGSSLGLQFSDSEEEDGISNNMPARDLSHLPPILSDVQESTAMHCQPSSQVCSERPVSKFKLARQKSKK